MSMLQRLPKVTNSTSARGSRPRSRMCQRYSPRRRPHVGRRGSEHVRVGPAGGVAARAQLGRYLRGVLQPSLLIRVSVGEPRHSPERRVAGSPPVLGLVREEAAVVMVSGGANGWGVRLVRLDVDLALPLPPPRSPRHLA